MAPLVLIASCHVATAPGEVVQLLLLGEEPWGSFGFAVGVWEFWGRAWEEFRVPLGCLIYCSLLGKGREESWDSSGWGMDAALLSFPKKCLFTPFLPPFYLPWLPGQWQSLLRAGPLVA